MSVSPKLTEFEAKAYEWLASDFRYQADQADKFADDLEAWGLTRVAERALGLVKRAGSLKDAGARMMDHKLIGPNTRSHFRNEFSIGLGDVPYAMFYAMYQADKYAQATTLAQMSVPASSIRVYAAECRVIAGMCDQVLSGKYDRIG